MKKSTKRLALTTQTIRALQNDELGAVVGGTIGTSGTSVISVGTSGTTVISVGTSGTSVISTGTSVISRH